jgi:hypothetical protein
MGTEHKRRYHQSGASDTVYGLGLIGAWIYYFRRAKTFGDGVLGFLKGIVWPAMLVYELLKLFNEELPAPRSRAPLLPPQPKPLAPSKPRAVSKTVRSGKPKTKKAARK